MTTARRPARRPERRGDLSGIGFLLFAAAMLVAIAAVAFVITSLPVREEPGGSPSPSLVAGTSSPPASGAASGSPAGSAAPSAAASATAVPVPTTTPATPPLVAVQVGQPAPITAEGTQLGTVTVLNAARLSTIDGVDAPRRREWLVVEVRYEATGAELAYGPSGWSAQDGRNRTYGPSLVDINAPLGTGTLAAGEVASGFIVFAVRETPVGGLQLADAAGRPLAAFVLG